MSLGKLYIGTSGWMYPHWKGNFYPEIKQGTSSVCSENLPQKDWLKFYSRHFNSVEINSSFYRQPQASTFEKWKNEVPSDFTFSIKGNRFTTHIKRLKDCEKEVGIFFESANILCVSTSEESGATSEVLRSDFPALPAGRSDGGLSHIPPHF